LINETLVQSTSQWRNQMFELDGKRTVAERDLPAFVSDLQVNTKKKIREK